jgi:hypothetical protein
VSIDRQNPASAGGVDEKRAVRVSAPRNPEESSEVLDLMSLMLRHPLRSVSTSRLRVDEVIASLRNVGSADSADLRARVHAAIDKMSVTELRALRLPVGYLFD